MAQIEISSEINLNKLTTCHVVIRFMNNQTI